MAPRPKKANGTKKGTADSKATTLEVPGRRGEHGLPKPSRKRAGRKGATLTCCRLKKYTRYPEASQAYRMKADDVNENLEAQQTKGKHRVARGNGVEKRQGIYTRAVLTTLLVLNW